MSSAADGGEVIEEAVGDPKARDFLPVRTVDGLVKAIEYMEVLTGCKTKTQNVELYKFAEKWQTL